MAHTFTDQDMRQAHADAVESVAARNNLTGAERKADQARTLAWLDKTFIDPDMQKAHDDAVQSVKARNSLTGAGRHTARKSLLRWLRIK